MEQSGKIEIKRRKNDECECAGVSYEYDGTISIINMHNDAGKWIIVVNNINKIYKVHVVEMRTNF